MTLSAESLEFVRQLVRQHSGVCLETDKGYLVEARLLPISHREGAPSLDQFVARLRWGKSEDLRRRAVESIVNTETSFFRDFHVFEAFRHAVLPDLLRRREPERRLRFWCAACSTGQEPYSVAMILHHHVPPLEDWSVRLLASDFSSSALEYARAGRYTLTEVNRGLPAALLVGCFDQEGPSWVLREEIRRRVEFQQINLMEPWPPLGTLDVVFLRNVLIYFETEARRELLRRIRSILRPDGCLILGGTETVINVDNAFEAVPVGKAVTYRIKEPAADSEGPPNGLQTGRDSR